MYSVKISDNPTKLVLYVFAYFYFIMVNCFRDYNYENKKAKIAKKNPFA